MPDEAYLAMIRFKLVSADAKASQTERMRNERFPMLLNMFNGSSMTTGSATCRTRDRKGVREQGQRGDTHVPQKELDQPEGVGGHRCRRSGSRRSAH